MRLFERKPRSQARCDFEPRPRRRHQRTHERPGIEALWLDKLHVRPQRIIEPAVHFEQSRTAASMRSILDVAGDHVPPIDRPIPTPYVSPIAPAREHPEYQAVP